MVLSICQMDPDHGTAQVRAMFWEYLQWANSRLNEEYGIDFDIEAMFDKTMSELQTYFPPDGRLLLAKAANRVVGIACMRRIGGDIGEIKRMYVRGAFRGQGIGRALLQRLLEEARDIGYSIIRLDSARFMEEAHSLYRSAGFRETEPYAASEIPPSSTSIGCSRRKTCCEQSWSSKSCATSRWSRPHRRCRVAQISPRTRGMGARPHRHAHRTLGCIRSRPATRPADCTTVDGAARLLYYPTDHTVGRCAQHGGNRPPAMHELKRPAMRIPSNKIIGSLGGINT